MKILVNKITNLIEIKRKDYDFYCLFIDFA
jgi:hypothetical protein